MAAFGLLHGLHEWYEMGQRIAVETQQHVVGLPEEIVRLALLVVSFVMLLCFAVQLLVPALVPRERIFAPVAILVLVWVIATLVLIGLQPTTPLGAIAVADGLALSAGDSGRSAGSVGAHARAAAFRAMDLSQFRARHGLGGGGAPPLRRRRPGVRAPEHAAVVSYLQQREFPGLVRHPVQLFRAVMAVALTVFLMRLMNAFAVENRRRLDAANAERMSAQQAAIMTERRNTAAMEAMNDDCAWPRTSSLLLDVSNLLDMPGTLAERLQLALDRIIQALPFANAGLMVIARWGDHAEAVMGKVGFAPAAGAAFTATPDDEVLSVRAVGWDASRSSGPWPCAATPTAPSSSSTLRPRRTIPTTSAAPMAPTTMIAYPVTAHQAVYGSIVLVRVSPIPYRPAAPRWRSWPASPSSLGVSIENALLSEEAQRHERLLGELLRQVVGAQETERQRIVRELHDATGQSLTAVGLGLRGGGDAAFPGVVRSRIVVAGRTGEGVAHLLAERAGRITQHHQRPAPAATGRVGTGAALRWYAQAYARRRAVPVDLVIEGDDARLPADYRTVLFRVAQESLTNIAKRARRAGRRAAAHGRRLRRTGDRR